MRQPKFTFTIERVSDGWRVKREQNGTHSHFFNKRCCVTFIRLMRKKEIPDEDTWMYGSFLKLIEPSERKYFHTKKDKPQFVNIGHKGRGH